MFLNSISIILSKEYTFVLGQDEQYERGERDEQEEQNNAGNNSFNISSGVVPSK